MPASAPHDLSVTYDDRDPYPTPHQTRCEPRQDPSGKMAMVGGGFGPSHVNPDMTPPQIWLSARLVTINRPPRDSHPRTPKYPDADTHQLA